MPWWLPIAIAAFVLWLGWGYLPYLLHLNDRVESLGGLGEWGDWFGGLSAFFSAAGFLAVVVTFRETQNDQHRQRFESTFFELLRLLDEKRNEVRFIHSKNYRNFRQLQDQKFQGFTAFKPAWFEAYFFITSQSPLPTRAEAGRLYQKRVHNRFESTFGPYFRILYTILFRIKSDSVLTNEEKWRYGNLLRSQLTSYEVALAALNGLAPVSKDFSDLLTEFRILKYLPNPGSRRRLLVNYYPEAAFSPRD